MFASIRGSLLEINTSFVVIEAGGVGYRVFLTPTSDIRLETIGKQVFVHLLTIVREHEISLYGFSSTSDRDLFERLIDITGVGPKMAMSLIGVLGAGVFYQIVSEGDLSALCRVPGVGKKTAERLLLDMRDKLPKEIEIKSSQGLASTQTILDAMNALMHLGYQRAKAKEAIEKSLKEAGSETLQLQELITRALKIVR